MAAVDRWQRSADRVGMRCVLVGEVELHEAFEAADERRVLAVSRTESEGRGGVGDGKRDAVGLPFEAIGEVPQQEE